MKCNIPADYHIEDIYKVYKKTSIANTGEYPVEYSIYHKILCDVHKMMMDKILLESKDILLPYIGSIRIKKKISLKNCLMCYCLMMLQRK